MTRDELIWIGIRLAGLYLLLRAMLELPSAITYGLTMFLMELGPEWNNPIKLPALVGIFEVFVYAVTGSYLVFKGERVFRLLTKTEPTATDG